jgi:hypothetical protein
MVSWDDPTRTEDEWRQAQKRIADLEAALLDLAAEYTGLVQSAYQCEPAITQARRLIAEFKSEG